MQRPVANVFNGKDFIMKYKTPEMIVVSKPVVNTGIAGSGKK